jgi:hypothetical protein
MKVLCEQSQALQIATSFVDTDELSLQSLHLQKTMDSTVIASKTSKERYKQSVLLQTTDSTNCYGFCNPE